MNINNQFKIDYVISNVKRDMSQSASLNSLNNDANYIGFKSNESIALKAQRVVNPMFSFKGKPSKFTEKDVNFSVTCCGMGNVEGNSREVYDFRASMQHTYGLDWYKNFNKPHIVRNGNLDEKFSGATTAIVFPLNPKTPGFRGADNMTMLLNGNIDTKTMNELVAYMAQIGVLDKTPIYNTKFYVNSLAPFKFMSNPKIKTLIAKFLNEKLITQANDVNEKQNVTNKYNISEKSINIANIDCIQNKDNARPVKDYIRQFLKNDRKFTVINDKFIENGKQKDFTAILIPSAKDSWDYLTVTVDTIITQEECKKLVNYLVSKNMVNVDNPDFRKTIVDYFMKQNN